MSTARFAVIQRSGHFDGLLISLPGSGQVTAEIESVPNTRKCACCGAFVAGLFEMRLSLPIQRFRVIKFSLFDENIRHAVEARCWLLVLPEFMHNPMCHIMSLNCQLGMVKLCFNVPHQTHGVRRCQRISY